jgi:hypothetical protein
MATGLYMLQDGSVMVAYGLRNIRISCAQYKANGYKPALEKLVAKSPTPQTPRFRPQAEARAVRP